MQHGRRLFTAISGSARAQSTNSALLRSLAAIESPNYAMFVHEGLAELPIFNPDGEGGSTPAKVSEFCDLIRSSDGLIISSPEYVRAIPGGLKNAIDWLVSRDEIVSLPVALVHASHRGNDMLASLRLVLSTVSERFSQDIFLRIPLMAKSPTEIEAMLAEPAIRTSLQEFLADFERFVDLADTPR